MTVLRELITVLGFDVDEAEAAQANKVFDGLKKGALAVVGLTTAATVALGALISETVAAGDEAAKTGKRLGISAEEVQELGFAAERSGVPVAQLNVGIRSLQRRAAEARRGQKEFAQGFARLGVSVTDANGKLKPTVDLFLEVADGFTKIQDEGERTALAMRVAGDGGAALLPLFLEGAEGIDALRRRARVLGFVLDNETAAAAERLADNFTDLRLIATGVGRRLASQFLPLVEKITDRTIDWFIANRELIDRGIGEVVSLIESGIDALVRFAQIIEENRRFLLILAAVLTAAVLPALLKVAAGYALVALAAIKAALVAAAPFLLVIALATLIALVIEDVFVFVSGGESAIGNFFEAFQREAMKPNAHWTVRVLFFLIKTVKEAIEAVDLFFEGFFEDALRLGGITEALKNMFSVAVDFWKDLVLDFGAFLGRKMAEFLGDIPIPSFIARFAGPQGPLGPLTPGSSPRTQPPRPPGGGPQIAIGPRQLAVQVDAGGATDPQAIADMTAEKVGQILEDDRRETARQIEGQVSR